MAGDDPRIARCPDAQGNWRRADRPVPWTSFAGFGSAFGPEPSRFSGLRADRDSGPSGIAGVAIGGCAGPIGQPQSDLRPRADIAEFRPIVRAYTTHLQESPSIRRHCLHSSLRVFGLL